MKGKDSVRYVVFAQRHLIKIIGLLRRLMRSSPAIVMPMALRTRSKHIGSEMVLNTDQGPVRVLTYNLENKESLPLFINIHGGGFIFGNAEMDDPFMMKIAIEANIKIISIDYSLAPEFPFPKAINQCYAVAKYVKYHPNEFAIDPNNIAIGGHSAGGNFSAAICLMEYENVEINFKCLILDYPPMDIFTDASLKPKGSLPVILSRVFDNCYCIDKEKRKNTLVSPYYATREQLSSFPPTLVITASENSLCKETEDFKDMLNDVGVDVTHKRFKAGHGFNLKPGIEADESWRLIIKYLKSHLWNEKIQD